MESRSEAPDLPVPHPPPVDGTEIDRWAQIFMRPGDVVELRVLVHSKRVFSGYFEDPKALLAEAERWSGLAPVYVTLNPVTPALLARANNRGQDYATSTTADNDIERRRWLYLDFDPVRPSGISSTDAEHEAAIERARAAARWAMTDLGWPQPAVVDSGNGADLRFPIDLPNDDASRRLIEQVTQAFDLRFSDDVITVDASVVNAARICRLPGTLNLKGDDVPERPHRIARLLELPETSASPITPEQLLSAASLAPEPPARRPSSGSALDLDAWLRDHSIRAHGPLPWRDATKFILDECPWNAEHQDRSAYVVQFSNGALAAGCHHNGCQGRDWRDLRLIFEPDAYNERRSSGLEGDHLPSKMITRSGDHLRGDVITFDVQLVRLSDVKPETIDWLWHGRVALGKITLLDGDPGQLKSSITLDLAARVTTDRAMPDGSPGIDGGVVLLTFEDGLADTIRPRLDAAGADASRIVALQGIGTGDHERLPAIPEDIDAIRVAIEAVDARLVIVDPLMAALSGDTNSHKDQDVRRALAPLARLAEETGVAVVVVRHLNKSQAGKAIYRGGGSIGIGGAARAVFLAANNPDVEGEHIFAPVKINIAIEPLAMRYRASQADNGTVAVEWLGTSEHHADSLLASPATAEERSSRDEAVDFLRDLLTDGSMPARDVQKLARAAGISQPTLERAKTKLGIRSQKDGMNGGWCWVLPSPDQASATGHDSSEGDHTTSKMITSGGDHLRDDLIAFDKPGASPEYEEFDL